MNWTARQVHTTPLLFDETEMASRHLTSTQVHNILFWSLQETQGAINVHLDEESAVEDSFDNLRDEMKAVFELRVRCTNDRPVLGSVRNSFSSIKI